MPLTYKHSTQEDLPKLNEWIAADPVHNSIMGGSHFILTPDNDGNIPKGIQCVKVVDESGIVFFLKFTSVTVVEVQFPPDPEEPIIRSYHRQRVRKALKEAFAFFSVSTKKMGFHAMMFESTSKSLIDFFSSFGFKPWTFFKADL